jgi:hypothetical protein
MRAWTGRVDCSTASVPHEDVEAAEEWIAERVKVDPEGVDRGDYFIDVESADAGEEAAE